MRWLAPLLLACSLAVPVPPGTLEQIATETLELGHTMAGYDGAEVVGASAGGCDGEGERYIEVAIDYTGAMARNKTHTMTVRYLVRSVEPCEVVTEVVGDTGPIPPLLLDNKVVGGAMGRRVCELMQ